LTFANFSAVESGSVLGVFYKFNSNVTVTIDGCTFLNCSTTHGYGGAISVEGPGLIHVLLARSNWTDNRASNLEGKNIIRGGAVWANLTAQMSSVTVEGCIFTHNMFVWLI